jgi:DNA-binding response OmpR family regulator
VPPVQSVIIADFVDRSARILSDALVADGYRTICCRPVDVRRELLKAAGADLLVVAVSRFPLVPYARPGGKAIPVLLISADRHDRHRGREISAAGVLVRPVLGETLVEHVRNLIGPARRETAPASVLYGKRLDGRSAAGLREKARLLRRDAAVLRRAARALRRCSAGIILESGSYGRSVPIPPRLANPRVARMHATH